MNLKSVMTATLSGGLVLTGALALPGSAHAALHGFCNTATPCSDNGINTPTSVNPPEFGFSAGDHSETGPLAILILVPDTISNPDTTYTLSGPLFGAKTETVVLFHQNYIWNLSNLSFDRYLFMPLNTSPDNALSDFLPATQALDPSATGYFVYDALRTVGNITLPSDADASNSDLLTLDRALPLGSYVLAFSDERPTTGIDATVSSGAIFIDTARLVATPEPSTWAMLLIGFAGLGFVGYRQTRGAKPQAA